MKSIYSEEEGSMYERSRTRGVAFAVAAVFLAPACSNSSAPELPDTAPSREGLTLTVASPESGVSGAFAKDGRVIYFQAARGERNAEEDIQSSPTVPEFAVDARFMDASKQTFLVQTGGGALEDPSWEPSVPPANLAERQADLELVAEAAAALGSAQIAPDLAPEIQALVGLSAAANKRDLPKSTESSRLVSATVAACSTGYIHYLEVHATTGPVIGTEHSAVYWSSYYRNVDCSYIFAGSGQSCNHGSCALDSNMTYLRCSWTSGPRGDSIPPFQNSYNGACSTPYSALSIGGGHNCNDDSYFQVYNIRNNTTYGVSTGPNSVCNDGSMHNRAPPCDGNM